MKAMNDILKRRLVGLLVLLVLVFLLSWLLPDNWPESGEKGVPSATLPLVPGPADGQSAAPAVAASAPETEAEPAELPNAAKATPPPASAASAAPASALPESVDAVDSSAPSLPAARSAPQLAQTLAAAPPAAPQPKAEPRPEPAPLARSEPRIESKPPVLKLAQSLPNTSKTAPSAAAPVTTPLKPPAAKPVAPPPVPVVPRLATSIAAPPPPMAKAASAQARLWYVQIGSFSDQGNAQTTQNLLQNIGYRGESERITGSTGNILYRVRLGPFPSEAVAQQAFDKVTHQGYPQARVLSEAKSGG